MRKAASILLLFVMCVFAAAGEANDPGAAAQREETSARASAGPFTLTVTFQSTTVPLWEAAEFTVKILNTSDSPQPVLTRGLSGRARAIWMAALPVHIVGKRYEFRDNEPDVLYSVKGEWDPFRRPESVVLAPGETYVASFRLQGGKAGECAVEFGYENDKATIGENAAWVGRLRCDVPHVTVMLDVPTVSKQLEEIAGVMTEEMRSLLPDMAKQSGRTLSEEVDESRRSAVENLAINRVTSVIPELLRVLDGKASYELKEAAVLGLQEFTQEDFQWPSSPLRTSEKVKASSEIAAQWARRYIEAHPEIETPTEALLAGLMSDYEKETRPFYEALAKGDVPPMEGLAKDDFLGICESTFRYMFENEANPDPKLNYRFISVLDPVPNELLGRFKDEAIPVNPPGISFDMIEDSDYAQNPDKKVALRYSISSIRKESDSKVIVECSVYRHMLAAGGYEYTLEKHEGKWVVVDGRSTWIS